MNKTLTFQFRKISSFIIYLTVAIDVWVCTARALTTPITKRKKKLLKSKKEKTTKGSVLISCIKHIHKADGSKLSRERSGSSRAFKAQLRLARFTLSRPTKFLQLDPSLLHRNHVLNTWNRFQPKRKLQTNIIGSLHPLRVWLRFISEEDRGLRRLHRHHALALHRIRRLGLVAQRRLVTSRSVQHLFGPFACHQTRFRMPQFGSLVAVIFVGGGFGLGVVRERTLHPRPSLDSLLLSFVRRGGVLIFRHVAYVVRLERWAPPASRCFRRDRRDRRAFQDVFNGGLTQLPAPRPQQTNRTVNRVYYPTACLVQQRTKDRCINQRKHPRLVKFYVHKQFLLLQAFIRHQFYLMWDLIFSLGKWHKPGRRCSGPALTRFMSPARP